MEPSRLHSAGLSDLWMISIDYLAGMFSLMTDSDSLLKELSLSLWTEIRSL